MQVRARFLCFFLLLFMFLFFFLSLLSFSPPLVGRSGGVSFFLPQCPVPALSPLPLFSSPVPPFVSALPSTSRRCTREPVPFRIKPIPVLLLFILFRIQKFAYSKKLLYLCIEFEDQTNPKKSQNKVRSRPVLDFVKYNYAPTRYKSIRYVLCQST